MKHKHIMISVLLLGTLLLSACGNNTATTNQTAGVAEGTNSTVQTQTQTESNSATTEQGETGNQPPQMTEADMKMMGLLGSLYRMNEQADLEITSTQATQLLPIVKEIVDANSLTDANQNAILAVLTEDQKTYINSNQNQMPSGNGAGGDGQPPQGTPPEGTAPNGDTQGEQGNPPQGEQPNGTGGSGEDRPTPPNGGQGGGSMGINPGQQLLDWLESKIS